MKTTHDLLDDLMREVKLRAVIQGRTLRDLVADFLRQGLGMAAPKASDTQPAGSMVTLGANGLPVIRCRADAPATQMSGQNLLSFEQKLQTQEDMHHAGGAV